MFLWFWDLYSLTKCILLECLFFCSASGSAFSSIYIIMPIIARLILFIKASVILSQHMLTFALVYGKCSEMRETSSLAICCVLTKKISVLNLVTFFFFFIHLKMYKWIHSSNRSFRIALPIRFQIQWGVGHISIGLWIVFYQMDAMLKDGLFLCKNLHSGMNGLHKK